MILQALHLKSIVALFVLGMACWSDLKSRKISNELIIKILIASLITTFAADGFSIYFTVLASLLTAFFFGLPFYLLKIFAGGDFKLVVAVSPLLAWSGVVQMYLAAVVWGAFLGLTLVILNGELIQFGKNMLQIVMTRKGLAESQRHQLPYSISLFFGFLTTLILDSVGGIAW